MSLHYRSNWKIKKIWNAFYPNDQIKIGDGFDIHHKDKNVENNAIENLIKLPHEQHTSLHKLGGTHSKESKIKISNKLKGIKRSKETRKKISLAMMGHHRNLGSHRSEETKRKMSAWQKGIPKSEKLRKKLSLVHIGKFLTKETREKISKSLLRYNAKKRGKLCPFV